MHAALDEAAGQDQVDVTPVGFASRTTAPHRRG
jgi:hypothetical protein